MRISVTHETAYHYDDPPRRIVQLLRLTPDAHDGQAVSNWIIDINCDADLIRSRDAYGNITHLLTIEHPPHELLITSSGRVDTDETTGVITGAEEPLPPTVYLRQTDLSRIDAKIADFAAEAIGERDSPLERAHGLLKALYERIEFMPGATDVHTTAVEAFDQRAGVCQDLAHLFCGAARAVGIPSRYVSGHLFRQDGQNQQPAAHAWAEAYVEDLGWVGFDPAHGISTDEHYVRVAIGPDYRGAAPIVGTRVGGGMETLTVRASTDGRRGKPVQSQTQSQSSVGGSMRQQQGQQNQSE